MILPPRNDKEAINTLSQQYDCLNKSWRRIILIDTFKGQGEIS